MKHAQIPNRACNRSPRACSTLAASEMQQKDVLICVVCRGQSSQKEGCNHFLGHLSLVEINMTLTAVRRLYGGVCDHRSKKEWGFSWLNKSLQKKAR